MSLPIAEALATASTGDIWLFRGRSLADLAIRTATNSPINHVGMAVALDDLPPLQWHAELGHSLPDVWTGERRTTDCALVITCSATRSRPGPGATASAPSCASWRARSSATTRTA